MNPSVTINDSKMLRVALEKGRSDEMALADLNKAGLASKFSAANAEVTLNTVTARVTEFRMGVVDTKYDFDREVFTVTAIPWLLVTQRTGNGW